MPKERTPFVDVLIASVRIEVNSKKTWCFSYRLTLINNIFKHCGYVLSTRMYNYYQKQAVEAGLMKVWKQWGRNPDGTIYGKPSNRQITPKGLKYLWKKGFDLPKYLLDWAYHHILPFKEKLLKLAGRGPDRQQRTGEPEALGSILNGMVAPEIV